MLRSNHLLCLAIAAIATCGVGLSRRSEAQSESAGAADTALTPDMRLLDRRLLERTRVDLEHTGSTFFAIAMYVVDTTPPLVLEVGP